MAEEPEQPTSRPPILTYVLEHREAVVLGLAILATLVAVSYALELRRQLDSPALAKMRRPCDCDDVAKAPTTTQAAEFYGGLDERVYGNGNTGLRAEASADRSPDASGGGHTG